MVTLKTQERLSKVRGWTRISTIGLELLVSFALPFLIYTIAKSSLGNVNALLVASVPPIARGIIVFARTRRIDALSILALVGIVLSLLAFVIGIVGGSARILQLRGQLVKVVIGFAFLTSAAIGKPLIYELSRATIKRRSPAEAGSFEALRDRPALRRAMMIMTLTWGISLVVEGAISYALSFVLTVQQFLLVNPILGYSSFGALTAWTYWYARRVIVAARQRSE
jgi:hypothetical protein